MNGGIVPARFALSRVQSDAKQDGRHEEGFQADGIRFPAGSNAVIVADAA